MYPQIMSGRLKLRMNLRLLKDTKNKKNEAFTIIFWVKGTEKSYAHIGAKNILLTMANPILV